MKTIRKEIHEKIGAALAPLASAPTSAAIFDNADDAIEAAKTPAVVFAWTDDDCVPVGMVDKHTLQVSVIAICKGGDAEDQADALLVEAHELMQANRHFDGYVKGFRNKGTHREAAPEGKRLVVLSQQYELDYMSQSGSLTERA